jgi:putative hemolysin
MTSTYRPLLTALFICDILAACGPGPQATPAPTQAALPNPASVFCEEQGGRLEIRTDASGGQAGFCVFADGSECEEWAYIRGECQPGGDSDTSPTAVATAAPPEGWEIYTHPALGYSFLYPSGSTLETDDIGRSITVVGPVVNNEHWPWFSVAHPDLEGYGPPADADLQTWLAEHNRLPGEVLGTRTIAGATAVHTRNDNGPQAYDDDRFYFVHEGRVYEITIVHAGMEDWSIYDIFLNSVHF